LALCFPDPERVMVVVNAAYAWGGYAALACILGYVIGLSGAAGRMFHVVRVK